MADVINLNRARKSKAKDKKAESAAQNRTRFGRTKAQRHNEAAGMEREKNRLDGKKREKLDESSE